MVKYDKDLIFLYSENSRSKIRDISSLLKKSPQRLKYSLKLLEKEVIINNPHCIFDFSFFGLILFRVYFKGGYISENDKVNIISNLKMNPYIVTMYELSGEFDLAIEIESPNPSRFNKVLKNVTNLIPTLANYKIMLNVVTHIYPRLYLIENRNLIKIANKEIIVGGDRGIESFNSKEMVVMRNLLNNPRIRLKTLANLCNLNIKTTISIVKNLQGKNVIKGYRYVIDTNKLGIYKFRLFLKLHHLSKERESDLMHYISKTEEIVQVNKTVGDWDLEIDIESFDKTTVRYLTIQIREKFKDIIVTFNIIEFFQYYKKSYLPLQLFNQEVNEMI